MRPLLSIWSFFVFDKESFVKSPSSVWVETPVINDNKTAKRHTCEKAVVYENRQLI